LLADRPPSWPGLTTVALGELPLQLLRAEPSSAGEPVPRKVLLPRKSATPLLHETLARHGSNRVSSSSRSGWERRVMHLLHSFWVKGCECCLSAARSLPQGADWRQPPQPLMPVPLRPASR
jgi:hypothetical protein